MPLSTILLASGSPRRRSLIAFGGWPVVVAPVEIAESPQPGETGAGLTRRLASAKAGEARPADGQMVLAADTVVVDGDELLGKPADLAQARSMLQRLRGRTHRVVTSIALRAGSLSLVEDSCESLVPMRDYGDDAIDQYLATGEPLDKAGGYAIQDGGFQPVDLQAFEDCFANVMGLPMCHVVRSLRRVGVEPDGDVPAACRADTGYPCRVYPDILDGRR